MAYNVTTWKTKELKNLRIPVASLYKQAYWCPDREVQGATSVFSVGEASIEGVIDGDYLKVTDIDISGECSGTALRLIFEPALADSRGRLVATRIWEGGDSIDRLTVVDGVVTTEPIEI
jgi:hypothetical protein